MSSPKRLIVEPIAGLANRMRVLASAIAVNGRFGAERVECLWLSTPALGAAFESLFEPIAGVGVEVRGGRPLLHFLNPRYMAALRNLFRGVDLALYNDTFVRRINPQGLWVEGLMEGKRRVYIQSCYAFVDEGRLREVLRRDFRPIEPLREQIEHYRAGFRGSRVVGLHVRRTDHAHAIAHSPIEAFERAMLREVEEYGVDGVRFFLSTDDPGAERQLRRISPGAVVVHPKVYDRNAVRGVQDALVDLYTLAGADKLYGSYGSSFSQIAALIGGIPLEIVTASR